MFQTYNFGWIETSPLEYVFAIILFLLVVLSGFIYQTLRVKSNPIYKFFLAGLIIKVLGGAFYHWIYSHYYQGGDTTEYYEHAMVYRQVFLGSPVDFLQVYFEPPTKAHYSIFWNHQVWPFEEAYFNTASRTVYRIITPLVILTNGSFLISTLMVSALSFFFCLVTF
jgi:hypothetical protein